MASFRPFFITTSVVLGVLTSSAVARADPSYSVQTYALTADSANAGSNYAGYNEQLQGGPFGVIASGYYGSQFFSSPGDPASATGSQSGTNSASPYLTAATDQATTTRIDHGATATAFASADLATGALRASASGATYANGFTYDVSGRASAGFGDALTFTILGATPTTVTAIGFTVRTDGLYGGGPGLPAETILAGLSVSQAGQSSAQYLGGYTMSNVAPPSMNYNIQSGWVSTRFTGDANDYTFSGVYDIVGANPVLNFGEGLQAAGYNGFADYSHTSQNSLTLPNGVNYVSASGVFLTASSGVPEPATWAMLLVGFAGFGTLLRRRRATVSVAA